MLRCGICARKTSLLDAHIRHLGQDLNNGVGDDVYTLVSMRRFEKGSLICTLISIFSTVAGYVDPAQYTR